MSTKKLKSISYSNSNLFYNYNKEYNQPLIDLNKGSNSSLIKELENNSNERHININNITILDNFSNNVQQNQINNIEKFIKSNLSNSNNYSSKQKNNTFSCYNISNKRPSSDVINNLYTNAVKKLSERQLNFYSNKINNYTKKINKSTTKDHKKHKKTTDLTSFDYNNTNEKNKKIFKESTSLNNNKSNNFNTEFYESQSKWKAKVKRKINSLQILNDRLEFKECTFSPVINRTIPNFSLIINKVVNTSKSKIANKQNKVSSIFKDQFSNKKTIDRINAYRKKFTDLKVPFLKRAESHLHFKSVYLNELKNKYSFDFNNNLQKLLNKKQLEKKKLFKRNNNYINENKETINSYFKRDINKKDSSIILDTNSNASNSICINGFRRNSHSSSVIKIVKKSNNSKKSITNILSSKSYKNFNISYQFVNSDTFTKINNRKLKKINISVNNDFENNIKNRKSNIYNYNEIKSISPVCYDFVLKKIDNEYLSNNKIILNKFKEYKDFVFENKSNSKYKLVSNLSLINISNKSKSNNNIKCDINNINYKQKEIDCIYENVKELLKENKLINKTIENEL